MRNLIVSRNEEASSTNPEEQVFVWPAEDDVVDRFVRIFWLEEVEG